MSIEIRHLGKARDSSPILGEEAVAGNVIYRLEFAETLKVLRLLHERIDTGKTRWVLTGSTSLAIRGVNVPIVSDIDIITTSKGCDEIDERLAEYRVRKPAFSSTDKFRSYYGVYCIGDIKIDVMGDLQYRMPAGDWSAVRSYAGDDAIRLDDMLFSVYSLERELAVCEDMGRREKADAIRARIAAIKSDKSRMGRIIPIDRPVERFVRPAFRHARKFSQVFMGAAACALFIMFMSSMRMNDSEMEFARSGARPSRRPGVTHYAATLPDGNDIAGSEEILFCGFTSADD